MQNLSQLGPENCRAYVFFAWCFFFVLFCFCFCFPVSEGDVPSQKLKMLYFWNWNRAIWNISANLDQAMSIKKKKREKRGKKKEKQKKALCVQACNWRWRSTKSSPNVEDGCTALCSFDVLAVVKCCKQCFIALFFFLSFFLFLYINSRLFYLSLWRMKINLFTKFWGKLLTNKRNVFTWWSLFTL